MSYSLGQAPMTAAQANRAMGWSKSKVKAYWDARAKTCTQFADEGECLAQIARHVPVTIGSYAAAPGLGDISGALTTIARIIADPEAELRRRGPAIVTAADKHVVGPLLKKAGREAAPYVVKYVLPPLSVLYVLGGISAYYSYQAAKGRRVTANRRRTLRRRRRRTSRR